MARIWLNLKDRTAFCETDPETHAWDHVIAGCPERRVARPDRRVEVRWPVVDERRRDLFGRREGDPVNYRAVWADDERTFRVADGGDE